MLIDTISNTGQPTKIDLYGLLQVYDSIRGKWLSINRESKEFGINHKNIVNDRWMAVVSGLYSNTNGYHLQRNCIVTSVSVKTQNTSDCTVEIWKNNGTTLVTTVSLISEASKITDNLDIDLDKNDTIQSYLKVNSGNVGYPIVSVEIAYR